MIKFAHRINSFSASLPLLLQKAVEIWFILALNSMQFLQEISGSVFLVYEKATKLLYGKIFEMIGSFSSETSKLFVRTIKIFLERHASS